MEPTKHAALMVFLQQSQVDLATAKQEKDEQIERAAKAEAQVSELRAVIDAPGSENMRRVVELQDEVQSKNLTIERLGNAMEGLGQEFLTELELNRGLENRNNELRNVINDLSDSHTKVTAIARGIQEGRDKYMELWLQEMRRRIDAERSDRRNAMYLKRARKSRNKAQRRLYALRRKVQGAENAA